MRDECVGFPPAAFGEYLLAPQRSAQSPGHPGDMAVCDGTPT